jgi:hypothetical protein
MAGIKSNDGKIDLIWSRVMMFIAFLFPRYRKMMEH